MRSEGLIGSRATLFEGGFPMARKILVNSFSIVILVKDFLCSFISCMAFAANRSG